MKLCEMYGCLPSQLEGEDYHKLRLHLQIKDAIETYQQKARK